MSQSRFFYPAGALVVALLALAGCGSASTAGAAPSPTATCPPAPKTALGTVASVNGNSLTVKTARGQQVTVNLASTTTLVKEATGSQSDLQDGERVQVFVTSNADGSYTAQRITIAAAGVLATGFPGGRNGRGTGGGTGSSNPCLSRTPAGTRTPGAGRGRGTGGGGGGSGGSGGTGTGQANGRSVSGTVATVNGQVLSVTASDGTDYTVQLDSATKYTDISVAKASDLQVGQAVTVTGRAASDGSITAQSIIILAALPTTPTGQS